MVSRAMRGVTAVAVGVTLAACGERGEAQLGERIEAATRRLAPAVERAVGLRFRSPPQVTVRTRAQVRRYLLNRMDDELPPEKLRGMTLGYRLFGLIPDTLDLRELLLALYAEQVVGYFDPDSSTLYVVEGADPVQVDLVLAHELVHALQGQYVPLDTLLKGRGAGNDEQMAVHAVFEGQATLASMLVLLPESEFEQIPDFWGAYRRMLRQQQQQMPVFNRAPLIVQETLIFPYLEGANFARWFAREFPDTLPFGPRLPRSTEQILHPERYRGDDQPVRFTFPTTPGLVYQDGLGEFEIRILLTVLTGSEAAARTGALGWDGDQYGVFEAEADAHALVWWTVWDHERLADRFAGLLGQEWAGRVAADRSFTVERLTLDGRPAVRLVDAPRGWRGWRRVPAVRVR